MNVEKTIKSLKEKSKFYKDLSRGIIGFIQIGTSPIFGLDTYIFSSIQATLESIESLVSEGKVGDSFTLLRLFQDKTIINIYTILFIKNEISEDKILVEQIEKWRIGTEKLPSFKNMLNYIKQEASLSECNKLFFSDIRYQKIRETCNNHTHSNFFETILLNDPKVYVEKRDAYMKILYEGIDDIFIMHFIYLFYINPHYMNSSDFRDCLDCGIEPQQGSEYWVAPYIQEIFTIRIKRKRPDLAQLLHQQTPMNLNM